MSTTCTTLRLIALLLLLAGILLLRKPLFGQTITAAPTRFSIIIQASQPIKALTHPDPSLAISSKP